MNILVTICARGGSKGIPKKNIKDFLGKPLIEYTLIQASTFINQFSSDQNHLDLCVSSDDDEVFKLADSYPCMKFIRSYELSTDNVPKVLVIQHTLHYVEKVNDMQYDYIIDLDVTSPLRTVADISAVFELCKSDKNCDVSFSAVMSRRNPYFNLVEKDENGEYVSKSKVGIYATRQSAPKCYDMNASIYAYKKEALLKLKYSPLEGKCRVFEMPETYVIDIDEPKDFVAMECLAKNGLFDYIPEIHEAKKQFI